jgi:aspartyl-tRNA synthetase
MPVKRLVYYTYHFGITPIIFQGNCIRDFITFPKNNAGKDMMIESPSPISITFQGNLI